MTGKGDKTSQKIVQKSLQLFSVKGYFNTSISDILQATGLTKGGLYNHFNCKEDIWRAACYEAGKIWRKIVLNASENEKDPLERIAIVINNDMRHYLGANVFEGGCFFLNSLIELSGQRPDMSKEVLLGFLNFSSLIHIWLDEADQKGILKPGIDTKEVANFIVVALNGAAAFYAATKNPIYWKQMIEQLRTYLMLLRIN